MDFGAAEADAATEAEAFGAADETAGAAEEAAGAEDIFGAAEEDEAAGTAEDALGAAEEASAEADPAGDIGLGLWQATATNGRTARQRVTIFMILGSGIKGFLPGTPHGGAAVS